MFKAATVDMELMGTGTASETEGALPKKTSFGGRIFALCCIPLVLLAVYYAPAMTSFGWHLLHGGAVDYRGLHVQVPWGWSVDLNLVKDDYAANPQGITVQKPPKTLALESRGPELIYINLLLPDDRSTPQQQAEEWRSLFLQSHPATSFQVADRNDLLAGANCIEATPRSGEGSAALACISLQQGWMADYAGLQMNVPIFVKVLSGLKQ